MACNYSNAYLFGFGGQEKDNEVYGNANAYTATFWEYDPRLGRRWNVDPITYPWHSSYTTFNSNPILYADPLGLYGTQKKAEKMRQKDMDKGWDVGEVYQSAGAKKGGWGYAIETKGGIYAHKFKGKAEKEYSPSKQKEILMAETQKNQSYLSPYDNSPGAEILREHARQAINQKSYYESVFNNYGFQNPNSVGYSFWTAAQWGAGEAAVGTVAYKVKNFLWEASGASGVAEGIISYSTNTKNLQGGKEYVYRVFGNGAKGEGYSWTPINPSSVINYRDLSGLPDVNSGQFIIEGYVNRTSIMKVRSALPLDGNKGGLIEYIIKPKNIEIKNVSGVNPEF